MVISHVITFSDERKGADEDPFFDQWEIVRVVVTCQKKFFKCFII